MTTATFRSAFLAAIAAVGVSLNTSCTVDQQAAFETADGGSKTKKTTVSTDTDTETWRERREAAKAEREKAKAEAEEQKAKELAAKEAAERKEEAREKELAAREEAEKEKLKIAEAEAREAEIAAKKKAKEDAKAAKIAAREKAEQEREKREAREELAENNSSSDNRGGWSLFGGGGSAKYRGTGHDIYVNNRLLGSLSPSNAKIEIDLSEQKARIFRNSGGFKDLVIETNISTGKAGYSTPTGSFRIKEKLVAKRSTRYGRWLNSSGATVRSDGDSGYRPSGATTFVGASMPYWMRVTGGIGMHIGYVPNYPASHGCIRVPEEIQPLIYSKVGVGTSVTIHH